MCHPQSLVSLIHQTVPAYLHEIKHKLYPQVGEHLGDPSQPKATFPPWEENATILEVSPAVPEAGSKTSSSHQLKNNEDHGIVILISKAGDKWDFKIWFCILSHLNGLKKSLYDWAEIIELFNISVAEYINHGGERKTQSTNRKSGWLAAGAVPAVVAGKLLIRNHLEGTCITDELKEGPMPSCQYGERDRWSKTGGGGRWPHCLYFASRLLCAIAWGCCEMPPASRETWSSHVCSSWL